MKNALPYIAIENDMDQWPILNSEADFNETIAEFKFKPCAHSSIESAGWISPCAAMNEDQLVRYIDGIYTITLQIETKKLPVSGIKKKLLEAVKQIEQTESRKVFRKEKNQLKEEIMLTAMPHAPSSFATVNAHIIPAQNLILIDTTSRKKADQVLNLLRESMGKLPITYPQFEQNPSRTLTSWILEGNESYLPEGFNLGDKATLHSTLGDGGKVTIDGEELVSEESKILIEKGYCVTKISINNPDMSLSINHEAAISGIRYSEELKGAINAETEDAEYAESSDLAIAAFDASILIGVKAITDTYLKIVAKLH